MAKAEREAREAKVLEWTELTATMKEKHWESADSRRASA